MMMMMSEYGGDLLEVKWKKGSKKDNDEKKDVEEKTMVVVEVAKTDIVFFNQDEVVGEAYQASADQTTAVSVKEQTIEVVQTEEVISHQEEDVGEGSQSKKSKEEVEQNKEEVLEGNDDDDRNLQNKLDPEQVIKEIAIDQTNLILMKSKVNVTLKKRHALTEEEINERTFKMACQMN
ncbi:hypothetical protein GIB67_030436 [Kingdonia uniflora]|uniref:Uncharacterized protein n=1 Tax=Kingdonia uniflora TaxID=39325 RepID=A0A7J7NDW3_9MAGN|nr:hypothetical protein GIB67_030436 [Kingdonia uniflora]